MRLIDANAIKYREYRGGGGREYPENIVTEDEIAKMPTVDAVEIDVLEDWLYEIANNNFGNELCRSCLEIANRLGGLRVFARERKDNE